MMYLRDSDYSFLLFNKYSDFGLFNHWHQPCKMRSHRAGNPGNN